MAEYRALVVEDSVLVAGYLEEVLSGLDVAVVGPVGNLDEALALAETETYDFAILDINLHGKFAFPVADVLRARGIPHFFSSGYVADNVLPERLAGTPIIAKPYDFVELTRLIAWCCSEAGAAR